MSKTLEATKAGERTQRPYKWTVEFEVSANWVADGFNLTHDRALEMLSNDLQFARTSDELKATIIKAPNQEAIRKEQGY